MPIERAAISKRSASAGHAVCPVQVGDCPVGAVLDQRLAEVDVNARAVEAVLRLGCAGFVHVEMPWRTRLLSHNRQNNQKNAWGIHTG